MILYPLWLPQINTVVSSCSATERFSFSTSVIDRVDTHKSSLIAGNRAIRSNLTPEVE